jgi:hypothetical protein
MTQEFNRNDGIKLKEYIDMRIAAIEKAIDLAADNLKMRLEGLNEWRTQNKEERQQYITKAEHDFVLKDIRELRESRAEISGRASMTSVYIAYFISSIGVILGFIHLFK